LLDVFRCKSLAGVISRLNKDKQQVAFQLQAEDPQGPPLFSAYD
jgi:hypothetical protein